MPGWARTLASLLIAAGLAACGTGLTVPGVATGIPRCDAVPRIQADEALYRDAPIYVGNEMPVEEVRAWAAGKPGFEEIWIDRDHHGWLTLAFSTGAADRQAELAATFPGVGVVVVQVPWTMAELEQLQQRVIKDGQPLVFGAGIDVMHGVVTIHGGILKPEVISQLEAKFGGARVCLEGIDPADAPADGPQQPAGEQWRLLADEDEVGGPYRTGIATDAEMLAALWQEIGLSTPLPTVDFQTEVVVWFGAVHGSSCPRLRLDDVRYDADRGVLHSVVTSFMVGACTADAIGHAYVVAVQRSLLPAGPFVIQLQADAPPPGVVDTEPTIVDADLSIPGSTLSGDQIHPPTPSPFVDPYRVQQGDYLEAGEARRFFLSVECGVEWLGRFDGYAWRTEARHEEPFVPTEWKDAIAADGTIDLWIRLVVQPSAHIDALAANFTLTYLPASEEVPSCP